MSSATLTVRPARLDDVPRLTEIARASAAERGLASTTTEDDVRVSLAGPTMNIETDTRVAEVNGVIAASATLRVLDRQAHGGGYVLSGFRGRGIGSALLRWLVERARRDREATELMTWTAAENTDACALIESFGFAHARSFFRMLHADPSAIAEPSWPAGVDLRALDGDAAIDAACTAWDGTFIDHYNFHPARRDEWAHEVENDPANDFGLWFFAYEGDTLAGFCLNQARRATDGVMRGGLGPIGTMRSHRGIGLGRALLRHSVRALDARGCSEVELGVDSQNPSGAVRLYESNGFAVTHEGRAYLLAL